jgi:hypothetical protein
MGAKIAIMVLNDGETYTSLGDCAIVLVDEDYMNYDNWTCLSDAIADGVAHVVTTFSAEEDLENGD